MTLQNLLQAGADDSVAISAPGRTPLDHRGLRALVAATTASLNAAGIGRNDRVAIVLANGPEMATCFLACANAVTSAPLNPAYRADEFEFYLTDLEAKALIVERASTSPAVDAARKLGVQLIELGVDDGAAAGYFSLQVQEAAAPCGHGGPAQADDVAMVLHTSGTT
ncbi:MAG: AMP-binding protein, partial [Burkholderiaceae bacterium]